MLEIAARAEEIRVVVVGDHLTGQPLNRQLTEPRRAALKPGLVREESFEGCGIDVKVWSMPVRNFGSFVALAAPPLGIGSVILADGFREMGFICEPYGLTGATEITLFGGWKNWRAAGG